ncbi:MAG: glycine zipper 2TM domain-containing protein [Betaproteobacteria bacterium]|nr:glycine zipper 2TM domain-containing protein [Betaproteobacteria bacterium]
MENTQTLSTTQARDQKSGLLYPTMLVAAIALIIFSVIGIAAITGLMPSAISKSESQPAHSPAKAAVTDSSTARPPKARAAITSPTRAVGSCSDCGVVSSIRALEAATAPSGIGAVAGGVVGGVLGNQVGRGGGRTAMTVVGAGAGAYAGNEIEKKMDKSVTYEIRVRLEDGSYRTFFERSQPALAVGQKVRITDNGVVAG